MFAFQSAVRGFHYYQKIWQPKEDEILNCTHEENNPYDLFAIKVCEGGKGRIVGHLPMEISQPTKFMLNGGATVTATLTSTSYRASPIVQGGLEIPCRVEVRMPSSTIKNKAIVEKYKEMLDVLYCEPDESVVIGCFLHHETKIVDSNASIKKTRKRSTENTRIWKKY